MEENKVHYVCTGGCGGVSPTPKNCDTDSCPMHEHPLKECHCTDNEHAGVLGIGEPTGI